ncbi:MAG: hypothetical protein R2697_02505 [Ilumatobacteraceae bacterium]
MALVAPASVSAATETSGGLLETATGSTSGPTAGDVVSLVPERLVETRSGPGDVTTDGAFQGIGRVVAGGVVEFGVLGRGGVPGSGVGAVVLNVTAVGPSGAGHLTVFPCGDVPVASSLNYTAGSVVANEVVAKVSGSGTVCVRSHAETDLVVDVTGYVASGAGVVSLVPERLVETRSGPGDVTTDGAFQGVGRVVAGGVVEFGVLGRGGVPGSGVGAVVLNVTAVGPVHGRPSHSPPID